MKPGDFVEVDYVGKIQKTGKIFDLTLEDVAKEENVYNPKSKYGSVVFIVGANFIMKGLDEALQSMSIGEKKHVIVTPDKAFGERNEEMVRLIPIARFKEQNLDPVPGAEINLGVMKGIIKTVSGGRVKVDFNHPLAGKTLEYDIEIKSKVDDKERKIKSVVNYFTGLDYQDIETEIKEPTVDIEIKKQIEMTRPVKGVISDTVMKWCDLKKVRFVETFEEKKEQVPKKEPETKE